MVINPSEFGIDVKQAEQVSNSFAPKIAEIDGYQNVYSGIIQSELNKETMQQARELRLKLVKVRTGIAAIHKTEKAFYLAAGRFVDALKNKLTEPVEQMEEKLLEIEETEKRLEAERIAKLKSEREAELSQYCENVALFPLGEMTEEAYQQLLNGQKLAHEAKVAAEKEAERVRLENEAKDRIESVRKMALAPFVQFISGTHDLREMTDENFDKLLCELRQAKADYDAEQARIREENERLRKEAEQAEARLKAEREAAEKARKEAEEKARKEREEIERKAREEKEAAEKEAAKLAKELADKKAAEAKAEADRLAAIEAEAAKGDAEKFGDYIAAIEAVMNDSKFVFKSKKFKENHAKGQELLGKTIDYLNGRK